MLMLSLRRVPSPPVLSPRVLNDPEFSLCPSPQNVPGHLPRTVLCLLARSIKSSTGRDHWPCDLGRWGHLQWAE